MSQGEFHNEYRADFNKFLKSPGGKYFMQALIAREIELTVKATAGESIDKQAKFINQFAGVNFARDMLQRFAQPPAAKKQG